MLNQLKGNVKPGNDKNVKFDTSGKRVSKKQCGTKHPHFEGKCAELKGYIHDCSDLRQLDMFTHTTKEIGKYIGRTYKHGNDAKIAILNIKMPTFDDPPDPPEDATKTMIRKWEKRVDGLVKREENLEENLKTAYTLI